MQLLYRIDLPRDDAGLVKRVLEVFATTDDDKVKVDQAVSNPARIWRLPATMNCRGDHILERPHRLAQVIDLPEKLVIVTKEQLEEVAGRWASGAPSGRGAYLFDAVMGQKVFVFDSATYLSAAKTNLPVGSSVWSRTCWYEGGTTSTAIGGWGSAGDKTFTHWHIGNGTYGVNGTISAAIAGASSVSYNDTGVYVIGTGWHCLGWVNTGTSQLIYIDGVLQLTLTVTLAIVNGSYYRLGALPDSNAYMGRFKYCDDRIYNRVLTADEMAAIAALAG